MIGSDMLFTAAILAVLLLFDRNLLQRNASKIASGRPWHSDRISTLLRPPALLLLPILALVFFVQKRKIISSLKLFSIAAVLMLIIVIPWSVRNYALFGEVVASEFQCIPLI
jgi:Gpi18-like mannosyltransferase